MQTHIQEYKEKGFCIRKQLLPVKSAQATLDQVHEIFTLQLGRFWPNKSKTAGSVDPANDMHTDMQALLHEDVDAYLAAARRSAKLVSLQKYIATDPIIDTIHSLGITLPTLATEQVLHINSDQLKIPGGYFGFATHQDWSAIQGSLDCVVVWAPLVPVNEKNFPLQVIPGSHKSGLLDGAITDNLMEVNPDLYDENDFIPVVVDPGDIVFMSAWTLHRTGIKDCKGLRISVSTRYENAAEPAFIERNYPCAYQRTVKRELITPGFPNKQQVKELFEKK